MSYSHNPFNLLIYIYNQYTRQQQTLYVIDVLIKFQEVLFKNIFGKVFIPTISIALFLLMEVGSAF
jgi:hypothetical protein